MIILFVVLIEENHSRHFEVKKNCVKNSFSSIISLLFWDLLLCLKACYNSAFRRRVACYLCKYDDSSKKRLCASWFVWVIRTSKSKRQSWTLCDETSNSSNRCDRFAFAWSNYFQFWRACREVWNAFWRLSTSASRKFCARSSFDIRLRFSFIWDSIIFLTSCWWICSREEWFFLSSRTTCRITFACALSTFRLLFDVCVLAWSWTCVWFYCSVFS